MFPKRLLAIGLVTAAVFTHAGVLRAQWVQTNGPEGGFITSLAANNSAIFAGTQGHGVYLSTDHGISWRTYRNSLTNAVITSLAASESSIFAGTVYSGFYRSTDNGVTWDSINNSYVTALSINGSNVYAGADIGAIESTDDGASWTPIEIGSTGTILAFGFMGNYLFVSTGYSGGGMYRSSDDGASWSKVDTGLTNLSVSSLLVDGNYLFAGTGNGGVFRSSDSGATWDSASNGLFGLGVWIDALASTGSTIFAATHGGIFLSTNDGDFWEQTDPDIFSSNAILVDGTNLLTNGASGIFRSTDGGQNWSESNKGFDNTQVRALTVNGPSVFAAAFNDGVFVTGDSGKNWTSQSAGLESSIDYSSFAKVGSKLFVATFDQTVFRSTDSGKSWNPTAPVSAIVLATSGDTLYGGDNGIVRSPEYGTYWDTIDNDLTAILSLAADGPNIYAGTAFGTLLRSTDYGADWSSASGLPGEGIPAISITDSNANPPSLLAGTYVGMYRSTNNGASWSVADGSLTNLAIQTFATYGSNIFAGTTGGVLLSTNGGTSWKNVSDGLIDSDVYSLAIDGSELFAGTDHSGVWRRPLSDFGISSVAQSPAASPEIQNYPNPFSQSTTISFSSESPGYADVRVVNLLGVSVARLYSGELSAGEHTFTWDASGFAPGMYECVVRMNGEVRRIALSHLP